MLNPENAAEQLRQWEVEGYQRLREARVALLPSALRDIALAIIDVNNPDPPYRYDEREEYEKRQEARRAAYVQLAQLAPDDRRQVFAAWFPTLETAIEQGYAQFARLPYQTGGSRKSFRAVSAAAENNGARDQWLMQMLSMAGRYGAQPLEWWAAWTPYLGGSQDALGLLFAAAIDGGDAEGEAVFETLLQSARGEHEIGAFGRHVCRALLVASRREGWEFMEKMLLAAQRQEGLRQVILETVDEAHPDAFARMLRVILDNDLCRFSAVIRAVDVWFGFGYDALNNRAANATIAQTLNYLEDEQARQQAIAVGDPNALYLALWAGATHDADAMLPLAARLLDPNIEPNAERRYIAAYFLGQVNLPSARVALVPAWDDPDNHVKWTALSFARRSLPLEAYPDLFERAERFLSCLSKKPSADGKTLPSIIWPWQSTTVSISEPASTLIQTLGERSPRRLLPYMGLFHSYQKGSVVDLLLKARDQNKDQDADRRNLLFQFVEDRDMIVVEKALAALKKLTLAPDEVQTVETLLKRTGSEYRRGVQNLLLTQPDVNALQSAQRLLSTANAPQRSAGLEMLDQMLRASRSAEMCRDLARAFGDTPVKKTDTETRLLGSLLNPKREEATLKNGLGLYDPDKRTLAAPPRPLDAPLVTPAALACLQSLDALIEANRELPLQIKNYTGTDEMLLGNVSYQFPSPPSPKTSGAKTAVISDPDDEAEQAAPPLSDLWETWWANRPAEQRDPDGLELLRAVVAAQFQASSYAGRWYEKTPAWVKAIHDDIYGDASKMQPKHRNVGDKVLQWLLYAHPVPASAIDFMLDAVEATFARMPLDEAAKSTDADRFSWRGDYTVRVWLNTARAYRASAPHLWSAAHDTRLFLLAKWLDQPTVQGTGNREQGTEEKGGGESGGYVLMKHMPRMRPFLLETLRAYEAQAATEADVLDNLIGEEDGGRSGYSSGPGLGELSGRVLPAWTEAYPFLKPLVQRIRERILEVELTRGDAPTAATQVARKLRWSGGMEVMLHVLSLLGKDTLTRSGTGSYDSRINSFSHLIRSAFPGRDDTPEEFARLVEASKISPARLIELAMYAPQWAGFVEQTLGWQALSEAVWWIHAHTKDHQWDVAQELKDEWAAQSAERTPLSAESLMQGAVDVAWFHRIYDILGAERWKALDEAAKYASSAGGHKRAQLFADAMLGKLEKAQLVTRIKDKRNQDALRALGLIPLDGGDVRNPAGEADALARYKTIQEFVRGSRQFGAQRQQSEKMAAGTAMENLARTAGYADPARLEWAMEASAVADLANGPISVESGGATITLSINPLGKPNIAITKAGKPLKAVPAAAKKDAAVIELQERKRDIDRQGSRMRLSLEQAMCRGDRFLGGELPNLMAHPVLAPMLRSIVFVVDAPQSIDGLLSQSPPMAKGQAQNEQSRNEQDGRKEQDGQDAPYQNQDNDAALLSLGAKMGGYPTPFGRSLESHTGEEIALAPDTVLRIAHPYDLLHTGEWDKWQSDCFRRERVQPFKQMFRELYVLTASESDQKNISRRYDGQQLNPKQALALLGSRLWVSSYEQTPRRTFHDADITACLDFFEGYSTPAEIEGLTINGVYFTRRGEWRTLPLTQVPPRVFSEAMRDLDLVVSVAHQGGVDPEASASTVEMRASLLRESLQLLHITNVRLQGSHALIDGKLGTYSLHLGSANVHRQPGGALCIVPVHSQHRGRLFLPFADDDPKTAEVISKTLLLANDTQIKDPIILEQILVTRQ